MNQVKSFFKFCMSAKKRAKSINYDVIHAHDIDGMIAAMLIDNKKRIIWDMHEFYDGFSYSFPKNVIYESLAKIAFNKASAIIYVVESQKKRYALKTKKNTIQKIVMNCPEEKLFSDFQTY